MKQGVLSHIGVLAGMPTLRWAYDYAHQDAQVKLFIGPNVFVSPRQATRMVEGEHVSRILVPSKSTLDFYAAELPSIRSKLVVWMAGVDTSYWRPHGVSSRTRQSRPRILIYQKSGSTELFLKVRDLANRLGAQVTQVNYGRYSKEKYRSLLSSCDLMVVLGGAESQGIAMFEAWSMDVPTMVYNNPGHWSVAAQGVLHRHLPGSTSASPYLTEATGSFWRSVEDLEEVIRSRCELSYTPRSWVIQNARQADRASAYMEILSTP